MEPGLCLFVSAHTSPDRSRGSSRTYHVGGVFSSATQSVSHPFGAKLNCTSVGSASRHTKSHNIANTCACGIFTDTLKVSAYYFAYFFGVIAAQPVGRILTALIVAWLGFATVCTPALGPPTQWIPDALFLWITWRGLGWPLTSILCEGEEHM
jgi:hypothetical protein